jgi:hypothetical membrane protein
VKKPHHKSSGLFFLTVFLAGMLRTLGTTRIHAVCSFRWIIVAESTVRWFIVREKHCWMAADSAEPAKRTG